MPIQVVCPSCGGKFAAPDKFAGKRGKCPVCASVIRVAAAEEAEALAPVAVAAAAEPVAQAAEVDEPPVSAAPVEKAPATPESPAVAAAKPADEAAPPADEETKPAQKTEAPQKKPDPPQPPDVDPSAAPPISATESSLDPAFIITGAAPFARAHGDASDKSRAAQKYSIGALAGALGVGVLMGAAGMGAAVAAWSWLNPAPPAVASAASKPAATKPAPESKPSASVAAKKNGAAARPAPPQVPLDEDVQGDRERRFERAPRDAEPPEEPERNGASQLSILPESIKQLAEECAELKWKPTNKEQYAKFQALGALVALAMAIREDEELPEEIRKNSAAAAQAVLDTLAETSWSRADEIIDINQLASENLESNDKGLFAYAKVLAFSPKVAALKNQNAVLLELIGTEKTLIVPVATSLEKTREGSRWLVLGQHNPNMRLEFRQQKGGEETKFFPSVVVAAPLIAEPM